MTTTGKKCIFIMFNSFLLLVGLVVLGSGIGINLIFGNICTDKFHIPLSMGMLIDGAIIIIVQMIGCFGLRYMSRCLLGLFSFFILIFFLGGLLQTYMFVKFNSQLSNYTQECLGDTILEYNRTKASKVLIDKIQQKLKCCGINGKNDWNQTIPTSCCQDPSVENCVKDNKNLFKVGCSEMINKKVEGITPFIIGTISLVLLVEFILLIMSCIFMKGYKEEKSD